MKHSATLLSISFVSLLSGATIVSDSLDDLSGFTDNANWSTVGGVTSTAGDNQYLTMTTGVPAPVEVGDSVTASIVQRISVGSTVPTVANQYATRIAITGNDTGGGGLVKSMWTRRQPGTGVIWGHALTAAGGDSWSFNGWNNISTIGLSSPSSATSDWFTAELEIVKQAGGYDFTVNYYDSSDALRSTATSAGVTLTNGLQDASTWYLNFGTEYQSISADISSLEVDAVSLTSTVDVVPEPSSALLLSLAGLGLLKRRR